MKQTNLLALFVSGWIVAGAIACSGQVALQDRPCPCESDWVCCASGNTCASSIDKCPENTVSNADGGEVAPLHAVAKAQSAKCLVSDSTYVYWQNSDGELVRAPIAGGAIQPSNVAAGEEGSDRCGLVISGSRLYTTQYAGGHIYSVDLTSNADGSFGTSVTYLGEGIHNPSSIAIDAENVYVTEYDDGDESANGSLLAYPLSASVDIDSRKTIASGQANPDNVLVDDTYAYWIQTGNGAIMRSPKIENSSATTIFSPESAPPFGIALANGKIYWATALAISSADPDGTNEIDLVSSSQGLYANALVADASFVYWADALGIHKVPITGGTPIDIATGVRATTIAQDATHLFWANANNEVWTAPK